jgi:hypothetical protein
MRSAKKRTNISDLQSTELIENTAEKNASILLARIELVRSIL